MKPEEQCKEHVHTSERWDWHGHRCSRRAVENGYCRLHAEKNDKAWQAQKRAHERAVEGAERDTSRRKVLIYYYDSVIAHLNALHLVDTAERAGAGLVMARREYEEAAAREAALRTNPPKRGES